MSDDPSEFVFLNNLPPPVFSSKPRAWDGIIIEQRHHSPDENELDVPPVLDHSITLHLGQPIQLVQVRNGRVYEQRMLRGDITLTPAGESSKWC